MYAFGYFPTPNMAQIQNSSTIKEIVSVSCSSISEGYAQKVSDREVILVANVNPKDYRLTNLVEASQSNTSGSHTIYTTSATKKTFITSVMLSFIKDATCDVPDNIVYISFKQGSAEKRILEVPILTLTAQNVSVVLQLKQPLLIDQNTTIRFEANGHTVGKFYKAGSLTGFEVESFEAL